MIGTLLKSYDPLREPEFCLLIIDIFYSTLSLESFFKLLPQQVTISIVEKLIETIFLVNSYSLQ